MSGLIPRRQKRRIDRSVTREYSTGEVQQYLEHTEEESKPRLNPRTICIILLFLYIDIASNIALAEFIYEESAQQSGFGTFQCINAVKAASEAIELKAVTESCAQQFDTSLKVGTTGSWFTYSFGWLMPLSWDSYVVFFSSFESNVRTQRQMFDVIAEKQAAKLVEPVKNTTWTYQYQVFQFPEDQVAKITENITAMQAQGWHIKDLSHTKVNGTWYTVIIWEKVVVPT